jgi:multidrug efflux pump subunit AcrB
VSVEKTSIRGGPIAWMARNGVVANLLLFTLLVGGLMIGSGIKQEIFPDMTLDLITVTVPYPGASPAETEQAICLRLEEAVQGLEGLDEINCAANEGAGTLWVTLLKGADSQRVLADIKSAVDRIHTFPADAERPMIAQPANRKEVISLVVYGDVDEAAMREWATRMRDELLALDGITQIEVQGTRPYETIVEVSQENLRRYSLTLDRLARSLRTASIDLPAGAIRTGGGEVLIRTTEQRFTAAEYAEVTVLTQADGSAVRLGDIAEIRDGFRDLYTRATFDGQPAMMLVVNRVGDQTPNGVAKTVKDYVAERASTLPPGLQIATWLDRSQMLSQRMDLLMRNAAFGLFLVILVLALFLEVRLAFWVSVGIPVSFLGALLLIPAFGASINMISLFGFILVLGLVVDDAIVIGENVYAHRQMGHPVEYSAIEGTRQVGHPVIFSILTTVAAFSPLAVVGGMMGKFMWTVPVVVVSVLFMSLIESLLILPSHLNHVAKKDPGWVKPFHFVQGRVDRALSRFLQGPFRRWVDRLVRYRYATVAGLLFVAMFTVAAVRSGVVEFAFFPPIEGDRVRANVELAVGAPAEHTEAVLATMVESARELIAEYDAQQGHSVARGVYAIMGSATMSFGPAFNSEGGAGASHRAGVRVAFFDRDTRGFSTKEFERRWREKVGRPLGVVNINFKSGMGPGFGAPIAVRFAHRNASALNLAADRLAEELGKFDGVTDVTDGRSRGKPQLDLRLRPAARSLGITETDLARQIRAAFFGVEAVRQQRGRDEVRVRLQLPEVERTALADLSDLLIRSPSGAEIPLSEAAEVGLGKSFTSIVRQEGRRVMTVEAQIDPSVTNAGTVSGELMATLLPAIAKKIPGLTYSLGGEQKERRKGMAELGRAALMALMMIYILLAIPFKSYIQPLAVMSAIPFGLVGATWGHFLMGMPLTFLSLMGLLALGGVVVNDSLVLVDFINQSRHRRADLVVVVTDAAVRRFRPIFLTSMTTFFGLLPMLMETSVQARFLVPMAISLAFGVLFSTVIILVLVPSVYVILEDVKSLFVGEASEGVSALDREVKS